MKRQTLLQEVKQLQKIAGLLKEEGDLDENNIDLSDTPKFYSKHNKTVSFTNGLHFQVGGKDPEGGVVTDIKKYPKGFLIMGQEYDWNRGEGIDPETGEIDQEGLGEEGYGYYYDFQGNEVEEDDIM